MNAKKQESFLLEIGVEELPARFIDPALEQLKTLSKVSLETKGLLYSSLNIWGTPRRLTVLISGLAPKANDKKETVIGPPPAAAKDSAGKWTPAAIGFAKAQQTPVESLRLEQTSKGERYAVVKEIKGKKTEELLSGFSTDLVQGLNFPKTMVWEPSHFRFARPLRWMVALYGKKVVRFSVAGVRSDRLTVGLLALGGQRLSIPSPEKYKNLLQGRCIIVDPEERRKKIKDQLEILSKKVKGRPIADPDHINDVVHITEYPVSLIGQIDSEFLKLPREVLVTVLRKHQKFFPLENAKGDLLPYFIGVRNGPSDSQDTVREGYERVTRARLSDAKFFFDEDSLVSLSDLVPRLHEIGFHEKLGTLLDKTNRVRSLVLLLCQRIGFDAALKEKADRVATLAKADLLTHMVGELPELQGVAGHFYGLKKEEADVARAVEEHYWPLTAQGSLPTTPLAAIVALADKMDTLAADFSVDLVPTGSADPYGLRRAGVGVLRILMEFRWDIPLNDLFQLAIDNLGILVHGNSAALKDSLHEFFHQRLSAHFENLGFRPDEVDAVLNGPNESLFKKAEKLRALKTIREKPEFLSLTAAIKRARNLLTQAEQKGFAPVHDGSIISDSSDPVEKSLYEALNTIKPEVLENLRAHHYPEVLVSLSSLKLVIDQFFEGVMVMADDSNVRQKRLALLKDVKDLFDGFADFSRLQGSGASQT